MNANRFTFDSATLKTKVFDYTFRIIKKVEKCKISLFIKSI